MKKQLRKDIDQIVKMWTNRVKKLLKVHNNYHNDKMKREKAYKLMIEMSLRLRNIRNKLNAVK